MLLLLLLSQTEVLFATGMSYKKVFALKLPSFYFFFLLGTTKTIPK